MGEERYSQQERIIGNDLMGIPTLVVGAGAIGSFFAMTWAKMGGRDITILDPDTIEDHNIANQLYPLDTIGKAKTTACAELVKSFSGNDALGLTGRVEEHYPEGDSYGVHTGLLVSAVDNMDVRAEIWKRAKAGKVRFFLDGRMGAQVMRVYAIDMSKPEDVEAYEKTLYPQSEAEPDRCAEKTIIYTVLVVAGLMLNAAKRMLKDERRPWEIEYDCVNNLHNSTYAPRFIRKPATIEEDEGEAQAMADAEAAMALAAI